MEDVQVTVFGWVGTDPEFHTGQGHGDRATFRLASTPRFFDRSRGDYREHETVWLGVKTWRGLAHNVASSVHKGDPVVVVGKLRAQVYKVEGEERRYQELEATSVGHDLTKGTSMFRRAARVVESAQSHQQSGLRAVGSSEPAEPAQGHLVADPSEPGAA